MHYQPKVTLIFPEIIFQEHRNNLHVNAVLIRSAAKHNFH